MAKKKISTHLYVLQCGTRFKIGVTNNIEKRIASLQTGNPEKIELIHIEERQNPTKAERYLHRCFHKNRLKGEWFDGISLKDIRIKLLLFFDQD
ncbi:MAG: GIY-YIG nuclease family protein [Spirochaetes bacterium]|nr:MAG: GIY-YIG nuclease family protein [Spirochaetota bacterium]